MLWAVIWRIYVSNPFCIPGNSEYLFFQSVAIWETTSKAALSSEERWTAWDSELWIDFGTDRAIYATINFINKLLCFTITAVTL